MSSIVCFSASRLPGSTSSTPSSKIKQRPWSNALSTKPSGGLPRCLSGDKKHASLDSGSLPASKSRNRRNRGSRVLQSSFEPSLLTELSKSSAHMRIFSSAPVTGRTVNFCLDANLSIASRILSEKPSLMSDPAWMSNPMFTSLMNSEMFIGSILDSRLLLAIRSRCIKTLSRLLVSVRVSESSRRRL